ncbi:MAG: cyclase family protein [Bacteroidales bacterium]|nr:cyclase family protein [Bacteroidales bacterium]
MYLKKIYLSFFIDEVTPTYGNRNVVEITKKSSMDRGDTANETHFRSTLHVGTHIDFPYHFYNDGQTMEDFPADFWFFEHPLFVEVKPQSLILEQELIGALDNLNGKGDADILIVKTGMCHIRNTRQYWEENIGLSPAIYDYLLEKLPNVRILGFDSISVSSFQHRDIGRLAHKKFLNPEKPVLLLEDMDLRNIGENSSSNELIVVPLMIAGADGVPCTVLASMKL